MHSFLRNTFVTTQKKDELRRRQRTMALSLFLGYSGYYLCRTNLSVATPLIIQEYGSQGIDKVVMGQIASVGVVCYAVGKVLNGVIGDFVGGKKIFIGGMIGSVLATVFFGLGTGLTLFFIAWAVNRLVQSTGWGGLVKITSNWFSYQSYGKIMGWLSLSFLFGDVAAKLILGSLLKADIHWRMLFGVAAFLLAGIALLEIKVLKEKPEDVGLLPPAVNPHNLFSEETTSEKPESLGALLKPYFKSFSFLLMLLMSFGLTAIRETLNFWLPTYLFEATGLSEGVASQASALYPLFGMVSILGAGYLSDTWFRGKRGLLILIPCVLLTVVLLLMAAGLTGSWLPLLFISLTGLLLLGPYSFLAGAMSLDAGGRKGAATASGLVDAAGYVGGTVALSLTGTLAQENGWGSVFFTLAMLAAGTAIAAAIFYRTQEKQ